MQDMLRWLRTKWSSPGFPDKALSLDIVATTVLNFLNELYPRVRKPTSNEGHARETSSLRKCSHYHEHIQLTGYTLTGFAAIALGEVTGWPVSGNVVTGDGQSCTDAENQISTKNDAIRAAIEQWKEAPVRAQGTYTLFGSTHVNKRAQSVDDRHPPFAQAMHQPRSQMYERL